MYEKRHIIKPRLTYRNLNEETFMVRNRIQSSEFRFSLIKEANISIITQKEARITYASNMFPVKRDVDDFGKKESLLTTR